MRLRPVMRKDGGSLVVAGAAASGRPPRDRNGDPALSDTVDLLIRFAVALAIGSLIGLERGWQKRDEPAGGRAAGLRTFALAALLGGVAAVLALRLAGQSSLGAGVAFGLCFLAFTGSVTLFFLAENRAERQFSATAAVAAALTFALGAYAVAGDLRVASALAVTATAILAFREPLHGWVRAVTWPELRSALALLAMSVVILPVLPGDAIGPFGGINPREVWLIAIVLAGMSFAGYLAVKHLGPDRGVLAAGLAGGLASSTAVTVTNARNAALDGAAPRLLAAGVAMASAVMYVRVVVLAAAVNDAVFKAVVAPLAGAALAALALGIAAARRTRTEMQPDGAFRNPVEFRFVFGFAAVLATVMLLSHAVAERFGGAGSVLGAAVAGLVDVDAITIATARLVPHLLDAETAAFAILVGVATDMLGKIGIGLVIGSRRFALEVAFVVLASLAAGAVIRFAWA